MYGALCLLPGLFLILTIIVLVSQRLRDPVGLWFSQKPLRLFALSAILSLNYAAFAMINHKQNLEVLFYFSLYLFLPTLLIYLNNKIKAPKNLADFPDIAIILAIVLPPVLSIVPRKWTTTAGLTFPGGVWSLIVYTLIVVYAWKNLTLNCNWSFGEKGLRRVFFCYAMLMISIAPLGIYINFLKPGLGWFGTHSLWRIPIDFTLGVLLNIALSEEIIFRGIIQNFFLTRMKFASALLWTSIVFGLTHIGHTTGTTLATFHFPNWWYVLFATIAGLAYGWVYHKTKSILASSLLHAMVDFTWILFFRN